MFVLHMTQAEALVIPGILREPNSISVLLFINWSTNLSFEECILYFAGIDLTRIN